MFQENPRFVLWLICSVGGVLGSLALAPVGWFPLAWIALVPLLWSVRLGIAGRSPTPSSLNSPLQKQSKQKQSKLFSNWDIAKAGFAWGFGFHGVGLWWLTGLHPLTWLGLDWWTSLGVALGCWLFVAVWGALLVAGWAIAVGAFWRWIDQLIDSVMDQGAPSPSNQKNWLLPLQGGALPGMARLLWAMTLWCAMETLGNWTPLWWTALGLTQSPHNLPLLHWGQVSGPITLAAILVLINGCIAEALPNPFPVQFKGIVKGWMVAAIAVLVLTEGAGFFAFSQPLGDLPEAAIEVGIVQGNLPNEIKFASDGWFVAVQGYTAGYQGLSDQGVDLVIFPETAIPLIWQEPFKSRSDLYKAIRDRQTPALLGVFEPVPDQPTNGHRSFTPALHNSLLAVDGTAQPVGRYSKRKLVPLGEYLPFQELLGRLVERLSPLQIDIRPGQPTQLLTTPLGQAIAGICYESAFAENFRYQAAAGGEWIVTASNNAHYRTAMFAQHHAQDVMRAIETDRWLASATNTGTSTITDPHGIDHWRSLSNTYAAHADTLYRRTTQTLYVRWGSWLVLPLFSLSVLFSAQFKIHRSP